METPSSLFVDCMGMEGAFDDGRKIATLDQSFPLFAESVMKHDSGAFSSSSSLKIPRTVMGNMTWDRAEDQADSIHDPDMLQQPMFVQPSGLYTEAEEQDSESDMKLRDFSRRTLSRTPELVRSKRPTASRKTTTSTKSDMSRSSNWSNSLSTATAITPPDPEPPKKRTRTKKIKKEEETPAEAALNGEDADHDGAGAGAGQNGKRSKFLERNRVAASKCREKKKQFVSELEEKKSALEKRHTQLQIEYNSLVTEVGTLKHELMTHAKCDDPNIDKWIANEARKFVQTSDLFGHQRAAAAAAAAAVAGGGPGQPPHQQLENPLDSGSYAPYHQRHSSSSSSIAQQQQHRGLGSFSSVDDTRRDSLAFSQGSPAQTSPTDMVFPPLGSPKYDRDPGLNFDHMPDELFSAEQH